MKKDITYFERPGPYNTEETIKLAYERALELGIKNIVVASSHGKTALRASEVFKDPRFNIVVVTICKGYEKEGWTMTEEEKVSIRKENIKILTCPHSLSGGVEESFRSVSFREVIAETLYRFSQGMKVCVEITLMAADAGLIPSGEEIIAIAGTDRGADTAIVIKSACSRNFKDLKIREIICIPR